MGTSLTGLKTAITRNLNKEFKKNFSGEMARTGLVAAISCKTPNPSFANQTKTKINNPELRQLADRAFSDYFRIYVKQYVQDAEAIKEFLSKEEKAELASYTPEQRAAKDEKFDAGMLQLKGIYMAQLRRLKEKYGTYITQLHPEDFIAKVGSEFFDEMGLLQDTEQMMQSAGKYFDFKNNADDAEFKRLSDYYNDAYVMLNLYASADTNLGGAEFKPNEVQLAFQEEAGYMQRAQRAEAGIGGPGLTAKQQKDYTKRVQKRFGKGNLVHRLIGRFKKK